MSNYSEKTPDTEARNTSWHKILSFVPDNSLVLDVGCSSGKLGQELKRDKGCIVYGTEIDKGDYKAAQKVLDKVFLFNVETDTLPKEIANKKFDVIIFADVIEHLVNPVHALNVVKGLLKPNGRIVFSIPNMTHISVRLQLLSGHLNYNETGLLDKTHLHFYDFREVQRVFAEAGLQMIKNDSNTLNYPSTFLKQKLADLGLRDNGFIQQAQKDINAQAFQFVGYSEKPKASQKIKKIPLKTTTPEHELTEYIDKMHQDIKAINKTNRELAAYIEILQKEKAALEHKTHTLDSSLSHKLGLKIRAARPKRKV